MERTALLFVTRYGQTARIATRIAEEIRAQGQAVDLLAGKPAFPSKLDAYRRVVLGGPIYVGKLPNELLKWAEVHAAELQAKDLAVFSVSLNAADERPEARPVDREILDRFCARFGLRPRVSATLKGALPYTKYGFFKRALLKRISRAAGGPTDTSRDYEMTDWDEVAAFARECAALPPGERAAGL